MLKQIIQTSDQSNTLLYLGILVVSGIVLVGYLVSLAFKNKRKK